MKVIFAVILTACTFGYVGTASAQICNMQACSVTVTTDSGTGKHCNRTSQACGCFWLVRNNYAGCNGVIASSSPGSGWWNTSEAGTPAGTTCWGTGTAGSCKGLALDLELEKQEITSSSNGSIAAAFAPEQTTAHFGWVGTVNRTGNTGRATSISARLDVCMGSLDTDSAIATNNATTCYNQYCGTSYNEYCNNNAAAVCQDRCECAINGVTHSTCNNL